MKKILFVLSCCLFLSGCEKTDMEIELEGNPTTGYEWTYEVEDESVLIIDSSKYEENEADENMVGVGGIYNYKFKALGEGQTTIVFSYARSFESGVDTIYKLTYKIKVDSNMKISLISKEGTYSSENIPEPKFD